MSSSNVSNVSAYALFNVNGLVALVTGGGSGIGYMIAKALAHNGAAKVYIAGRRLPLLEKAAGELGPNVSPLQCDVTSKEELQRAAKTIADDAGYLNLLVCNSGIGGPQVSPLTPETKLEDWADQNFALDFDDYVNTFKVNSAAVWYTTMAFLKLLDLGNQKGNVTQSSQVIVTSSIAAYNKKAPGGWAYGQSKAAATLAVKQLSVALPQWNIRANCIAPGLFPSEMSEPIVKRYAGSSGTPGAVPTSMIPMGRMGSEEDMAGTLLYYASRAGAYTNGDVIVVDGGRLNTFPCVN
ncbi:uncharacterized protein F5Z01DRAFT_288502 [Emericellopsis atlantica]|uniref:Uncharacterized protein n=1 Tax=Emericellopsis atlantica TaxID=2614577 RepID=A0A9P7ZGQ8_9HYPO|nr:uncharacterized protein F5Z01DRAFT_288502 [Emericellopsis atlantica]KAG9251255.1 hypothetical protein F5Z01DRAFT_288502 [Emericellopsis atlantica]